MSIQQETRLKEAEAAIVKLTREHAELNARLTKIETRKKPGRKPRG